MITKSDGTDKTVRKKFDLDLDFGQAGEDRLGSVLGMDASQVEVKTERDWWYKTGNICIEIESYGKPSGIMATESKWWVQIVALGDFDYCKMIFPTEVIKQLVKTYSKLKTRVRYGGDNKASKMVLIPMKELFHEKNLEAFMQKGN